jgi:endo-1,4-beta-xylanase
MTKLFAAIALPCFLSFSPTPCNEEKLFQKAPFPIGTAINTDKLRNEENYWTKAIGQFNSFTPEKILKPAFIHPQRNSYNFREPDHLMGFCRQNNIRLHGHALIWHKALPLWMENFKGDASEWELMLKEHVQTVINHCKVYIKSWDVVNEAFNDDGSLRRNIWLKNIGPSYIEKAFKFAMQADTSALLFYNDYSLEHNGVKLDAVLRFFNEIKKKGISVHGIGMQMHVGLKHPRVSLINEAAQKIQQDGFIVHYSELDITLIGEHPLFMSGKKLLALQEARYKEIVKGYMRLNREKQFGITLWGVSDNDSWLTDDHLRARPLLFDLRYRPKPALCGFLEGLQSSL